MSSLENYGILNSSNNWQLSPDELQNIILRNKMGIETESGVLAIYTGLFTGRSPADRFIVKDSITEKKVWWNDKFNRSFDPEKFNQLYNKIVRYLSGKKLYIRDCFLCSDKRYQLNVRSISEYPWSDLFVHNLFFRVPKKGQILPDWLLLCTPGFQANPITDGTRSKNFSILNFYKKIVLIGGSGYTGEIKKSIFSVLNFILPNKKVLPMHCSANIGKIQKDTALFFGLSGTGKTTISNDTNRKLIGDDEHGWTSDNIIFNFEGGCYAKILGISKEKEPMIYQSIRKGAMLENVLFKKGTKEVDFFNDSITQNIRISYPIYFINNIEKKLLSSNIRNIFFLTYDAFGVLPPIAKLNKAQSAYYFLLGYTSKVAGTELNIIKPQATFSSCFGAPFMPLNPIQYTKMLIKKLDNPKINVWMVNTGIISSGDTSGSRIKLRDTRKIVQCVLNGSLSRVDYERYPVFNFYIPKYCPGIYSDILNPKNTWKNKKMYQDQLEKLVKKFMKHFDLYRKYTNKEILSGEPKIG
ncbi:MAG: phosphoenolpyruvate carboxykinase (ATP) [Flavobacteriales bacterium]|jgi:phosphoenolpyruvate carboxykinase (ATP)|uniref:phosphoenolpyruvate carboxykinase (ATP) n=1 Tax=Blattabacterium sp. (Mastotermes darwiniensis) TaxID=39768 RepID=UPI000231DEFF|nr:phosphoenolpyruvate carboxykinase (ATP) [Blattabacterium sp. (Mastotermes darwiniensis)]AER40819.1 phosphoenolpyruvate carboxykinase [Blattabacterium sp. (Mastotermes darwiniensis) str. MADAR]MDR1804666.1 phosphoenolpyruvate carboxykinase (ATP) [Flavobacteriales bacterium]